MAKIQAKEKAQKLRRGGESIAEIATLLDEGKSSVSYWCRDIRLTNKQIQRLKQKSKHAGQHSLRILNEKRRRKRLTATVQEDWPETGWKGD